MPLADLEAPLDDSYLRRYPKESSNEHYVAAKDRSLLHVFRGIQLLWWTFFVSLCPLLTLLLVNCWSLRRVSIHREAASFLADEVILWVNDSIVRTLQPPIELLTVLRQVPLDADLCSPAAWTPRQRFLLARLARLGPLALELERGGQVVAEVQVGDDSLFMSATPPGGTMAACSLPLPTASNPEPIPTPMPANRLTPDVPFEIAGSRVHYVSSQPTCQAGSSTLTCGVVVDDATTAYLTLPTAPWTRNLAARLDASPTYVKVVDQTTGFEVVGASRDRNATDDDDDEDEDFRDDIPERRSNAAFKTSEVFFLGAVSWRIVVAVPLAAFTLEQRSLAPAITAALLLITFGPVALWLATKLSGMLRDITKLLEDLQDSSPLESHVFSRRCLVSEVNRLATACNTVSALTQRLRASTQIVPHSESTGSTLAHRRSPAHTIVRQTSNITIPAHLSSSLLEMSCRQAFTADKCISGALRGEHLVGDRPCAELFMRLGSVLVVELWYQGMPLSHLTSEIETQESIGHAFLQMALECLEETRGVLVRTDVDHVVAAWNVHSSQDNHEYWACKAALQIQQRFPTTMNALHHLFVHGHHLCRAGFRVSMALAHGPLIGGIIHTPSKTSAVVYGDALRMAERLTALNGPCGSTILMPQPTFEAVRGYVTAEIVDFVRDVRREHPVVVYQLLGSGVLDPSGFASAYKDALIAFSHHDFEVAQDKLAFAERIMHEATIPFLPQRRTQCQRLQNLIARLRQMPAEDLERDVPRPYFREYNAPWTQFESVSAVLQTPFPLFSPEEPQRLPQSATVSFAARAGFSTITADVLQELLAYQSGDEDLDLVPPGKQRSMCRRSGIVRTNTDTVSSPHLPGFVDLYDSDGGSSLPTTTPLTRQRTKDWNPDAEDCRHGGDSAESSRNPKPTGIAGQAFRDIFGRLWQCSNECLGQGGFGAVYLGLDEQGKISAIKEHKFKCTSERIREKMSVNEIVMLWNLQHKNIVSYQGCAVVGNSLALMMEYISCGSLEFIVATFGCVAEGVAVQYTRDVVRGLAFLHANGVVHLDIKPANVLLTQSGTCKLADFGTAAALSGLIDQGGLVGTPTYMAPERVAGVTSDLSDVWSWGITLAEVLSGTKPYDPSLPHEAVLFGLHMGTLAPKIPDHLSLHTTSFLMVCLTPDPSARAHAAELLGHPFLL